MKKRSKSSPKSWTWKVHDSETFNKRNLTPTDLEYLTLSDHSNRLNRKQQSLQLWLCRESCKKKRARFHHLWSMRIGPYCLRRAFLNFSLWIQKEAKEHLNSRLCSRMRLVPSTPTRSNSSPSRHTIHSMAKRTMQVWLKSSRIKHQAWLSANRDGYSKTTAMNFDRVKLLLTCHWMTCFWLNGNKMVKLKKLLGSTWSSTMRTNKN